MSMSAELDSVKTWIALGCAVMCALAHLANTQTSDRPPSARKLRGQLGGAFIVGALVSVGLDMQPWVTVGPLAALAVAAAIGFVYGPAALVVGARWAAKKYNFEPPPGSPPPKPPDSPPEQPPPGDPP